MDLCHQEQQRYALMERIVPVRTEGAVAAIMAVSRNGCLENSFLQKRLERSTLTLHLVWFS
jgi:hypothetical protein